MIKSFPTRNSSQNDHFFKTVPARLGAQKEKYIPLGRHGSPSTKQNLTEMLTRILWTPLRSRTQFKSKQQLSFTRIECIAGMCSRS